jgi:long-chain acyl-CoA synthetase
MIAWLLAALDRHAAFRPAAPALVGDDLALDYAGLRIAVNRLARQLAARRTRVLAMFLDNGPEWAVVELAARQAGVTVVPLPPFFSLAQIQHVCRDARVDTLVTDRPADLPLLADARVLDPVTVCTSQCAWISLPGDGTEDLAGIATVAYTSGTTGTPKGVMLTEGAIESVVTSLARATGATADDRHLCLLPLGVLLENVAGLYLPLMVGATAVLPRLANVGLRGASGVDSEQMLAALRAARATTAITVPQSLQALVELLELGSSRPPTLRFVAVGGAPISPRLLHRAGAVGLPVYEGYGLSECGSVVSLNTRCAHRVGSVGRPLGHVQVDIAPDGEICVAGDLFAGYLGAGPRRVVGEQWATGDLGYLDDDGFLHVTGRKKHQFITPFGRNVAPEWVERELTLAPAIAQAAVFGEGRPWNAAVLVVAPGHDATAVAHAIDGANGALPDYAQVRRWIAAVEPFTPGNGLLSGNGQPRRSTILSAYREVIDALYPQERVGG